MQPDKIKQSLEYCAEGDAYCYKCEYQSKPMLECTMKLAGDALAYIFRLEQERDAAVADLEAAKDCNNCRHNSSCETGRFDCHRCLEDDCPCLNCQYEWRGVKEDENA